MGDVHHRSCFEKTVLFFGRALGFEHIISIFGLTEYVHHTTIEGIGMIAALVVERVPQTAADVLIIVMRLSVLSRRMQIRKLMDCLAVMKCWNRLFQTLRKPSLVCLSFVQAMRTVV